jgi:hypothetical protein
VIDGTQPTAGAPGPKAAELREVIQEFGRHLDMLAEQLGGALSEANRECNSVGDSFHDMASAKTTIEAVRCADPERAVLRDSCKRIGDSLHAAVVALQYHDRLAQRLTLVRTGLNRLQRLLHERPDSSYGEWLQALRDVEQINRTEQQRVGPDASHDQLSGAQRPALAHSSVELF